VCLCFRFGAIAFGEDSRTEFPPIETGVEAVRRVFDVKAIRPLDRSSFDPLRRYFSARQQTNVEHFLVALTDLTTARDQAAARAGIKQKWWWPPNVDLEVHLATKDDPLTDRAVVPNKLSISKPRKVENALEITVKEVYTARAQDGTGLGGTKTSKVMLVPQDKRWTIDEITFTAHQYGKTEAETLTKILGETTKRLRNARQKITSLKISRIMAEV
jgi:hypothetical protein